MEGAVAVGCDVCWGVAGSVGGQESSFWSWVGHGPEAVGSGGALAGEDGRAVAGGHTVASDEELVLGEDGSAVGVAELANG